MINFLNCFSLLKLSDKCSNKTTSVFKRIKSEVLYFDQYILPDGSSTKLWAYILDYVFIF